jgi:hypothetical protein
MYEEGSRQSWSNLRFRPTFCLEEVTKTIRGLTHDNRSPLKDCTRGATFDDTTCYGVGRRGINACIQEIRSDYRLFSGPFLVYVILSG